MQDEAERAEDDEDHVAEAEEDIGVGVLIELINEAPVCRIRRRNQMLEGPASIL